MRGRVPRYEGMDPGKGAEWDGSGEPGLAGSGGEIGSQGKIHRHEAAGPGGGRAQDPRSSQPG
jgi:hypothetical protein